MRFGSETELVLGEPEEIKTVEVEFPCDIEYDAVPLGELTLADTVWEEGNPEALSNDPEELNTNVSTGLWV